MKRSPMPHQVKGFNAFWAAYDHGERNICLTGPCGTGKTFLTTLIVHEAARRGLRVNFVTHRKLLLAQTSKVFIEENLPHGIRAADYEPDLDQSIQLSSRDTEISRCVQSNRMSPVMADIVIIDEAHVNKAGEILKLLEMQREMRPEMCVVGLTATPVDIWHMYDHLIKFASNSEMRASTPPLHLPCRVFAPDVMDISMLKRNKTGDFVDGEGNPWSDAKTAPTIFGRVLPHYKAYNPEQRPTILFAPSVASSLYFVDLFIAAGFPAAHIDGECIYYGEKNPDGSQKVNRTTDPKERDKVFQDLRSGEIKVLCNRFVCLDSKTEILTDRGWVGMDDISESHKVANWEDGQVYFDFPSKIIKRKREVGERMVTLETPRRSIRVTENHDLLYRTTRDGAFRKDQSKNLVDRSIAVPVSGISEPLEMIVEQPRLLSEKQIQRRITSCAWAMRQRGDCANNSREEAERRIREKELLRYKNPSELTNEECEFIGFWIGDGSGNKLKKGGIEYKITQSSRYPNIVSRIFYLIESMGIDSVVRKKEKDGILYTSWSMSRGTGGGSQKRRGLFHLEPYLKKDGCELLWGLNQDQFTSLVRGLWMANGCPHHDNISFSNRILICGLNTKLFDLLQAIAVCRGYRASIRSYKQSQPGYAPLSMLTMSKTDEHRMTKHRLKFEDEHRDEYVWCVRSTSGNIITRRNGSATVMGNCIEGLDLPEVYHLILATPFGSLTTYLQAVGRVQRAHPSLPGHVVIQDHGGSVIRFGHPDLDRDWKVGDSWQDFVKDNDIEDQVTQPEKNKEENREEILCECGQYRMGGPVCPNCGKSAPKRHIMVLQINGTLKPLTKKKIDKSKLVPSPVKGMSGALHAMSHSGKMTYNQALALLKREHPSLKWHTNIDSQGNKRHAVLVDGDIWFAPMLPPIDDKHAWALKVSKTDREFKRLYNLPSQ